MTSDKLMPLNAALDMWKRLEQETLSKLTPEELEQLLDWMQRWNRDFCSRCGNSPCECVISPTAI